MKADLIIALIIALVTALVTALITVLSEAGYLEDQGCDGGPGRGFLIPSACSPLDDAETLRVPIKE